MPKIDETKFTVVEHSFKEKAGKNPQYKVILENAEGDRLSKKSDDEILFRVYPLQAEINIIANSNQKTLDLEKAE